MNIEKTQRINQMLRERKAQRKKVEKYRNDRIKHKYDKIKTEEHQKQQNQQKEDMSIRDQRKIDFYKQVFEQLPKSNADRNKSHKHVTEKVQTVVKNNHEEEQHLSQGQDDHIVQSPVTKQAQKNNKYEIPRKSQPRANIHQQIPKSNQIKRQGQKFNDKGEKNHKFSNRGRNERINQNKNEQNEQNNQLDQMFKKADKLKQRKKKFIKKMDQRTSKGQPVMKNYIKYALTKLQGDLLKQKIGKVVPNGYKKPHNNNNKNNNRANNKNKQFTGYRKFNNS